MTNEVKGQNYVKKIIEEYNILLKTWGHSDDWNQSQLKTLEDMLYEATRIQVNANTLKRFFQQRTGNPQLATKEALCKFLGYTGYTDFVMKMTETGKKSESERVLPDTVPETNGKKEPEEEAEKLSRQGKTNSLTGSSAEKGGKLKKGSLSRYMFIITFFAGIIFLYLLYSFILKDWYTEYQLSKIEFYASKVKGKVPLTITFHYDIPATLFDDITIAYEEANGDISEKTLNKETHLVNATYIYEGEAYCYLMYKGRKIRTIHLVALRLGWSVYVREERQHFFQTLPISDACTNGDYISLPYEKVPSNAKANHLFVSYVFYRENLIDGDNFLFEARMRNSESEYAIPCADIIMYIGSDTHRHGFAMNEDGYAYIRFISGEKSITGEEHNLSHFNFKSSEWHIMSIKVVNKSTTFCVDGKEVLNMSYQESCGMANELILRFKGCGAVDYVKVSKLDGEVVYQEDFDDFPVEN
jgi:hypothetical protein